MIKGLIWNIRGVANTASVRRLRRLVRLHHPLFVVLIEPMVSSDRIQDLQTSLGFPHFLVSATNKIWLLYSSHCTIVSFIASQQYLHLQLGLSWDQSSIFATFVYGKCSRVERQSLWMDLRRFHSSASLSPWLIAGDFNVITDIDEYFSHSTPDLASISDFQACIHDCELLDLPFTGSSFTWTGIRSSGRVWKRLDRAMVNHAWMTAYGASTVDVLSRTGSDHCPLLLHIGTQIPPRIRPFKFQTFWTTKPDFLAVVQSCWMRPSNSFGMFRFAVKLKRLRYTLKAWNATTIGNIFHNLSRAEDDLKSKELLFQATNREEDLISLNLCQATYFRALADEEMFWKQKARIKWLTEGDHNTKLFQAAVKDRRVRSTITRIKDSNGSWIDDPAALQAHALDFFSTLLTEEPSQTDDAVTDDILRYIPTLVSESDNASLLRPVGLEDSRCGFRLGPRECSRSGWLHGCFLSQMLGCYSSRSLIGSAGVHVGCPPSTPH